MLVCVGAHGQRHVPERRRGSIANPMSREERLSKVNACARQSLQPADIARVIGMVEALETLPDLRQLMVILGHKSVP